MTNLKQFRVAETTPFGLPGEQACEVLNQAYSLASALTQFDAQAEGEGLNTINPLLTRLAIDGIGTLVALSIALLEEAEGGAQ